MAEKNRLKTVIFAALMIGVFFISIPIPFEKNASASITHLPNGDILVTNGSVWEINETTVDPLGRTGIYGMQGNITINNATLIIRNAILEFLQDCGWDGILNTADDNAYHLRIENRARLIMKNSTLTVSTARINPYVRFNLTITTSSFGLIENSKFIFPGVFNITGGSTVFINNSIIKGLDDLPSGTYGDKTSFNYDDNDDAPFVYVSDSNLTLCDSKIIGYYENMNITKQTIIAEPSQKGPSDNTGELIQNLTQVDSIFYKVRPGRQMYIDSFDVRGMRGAVRSAKLTIYATTETSYNGTAPIMWALEGEALKSTGIYMMSGARTYTYDLYANGVNTYEKIATLNISFTHNGNKGNVSFDLLVIETKPSPVYSIVAAGSATFIAINTFLDVDWQDVYKTTTPGTVNKFELKDNAVAHLYAVTVNETETMVGTEYRHPAPPFLVSGSAELRYYRWLVAQANDKIGQIVKNARVKVEYNPPLPTSWLYQLTTENNTLDSTTLSKRVVLAYLNRASPYKTADITTQNYNITGVAGKCLLPLITDYINARTGPNGKFVGNYYITVTYTMQAQTYSGVGNTTFSYYPWILPVNNTKEALITLHNLQLPSPDLMVASISFAPANPYEYQTVIINATIANIGAANASDVQVAFIDLLTNAYIGNTTIPFVQNGISANTSISYQPVTAGVHQIRAVADPLNVIKEIVETNNELVKPLIVNKLLPDLLIYSSEIYAVPVTPENCTSATLNAVVHNYGNANVSSTDNIVVEFYDGDPSTGGVYIGKYEQTGGLVAGGSITATISWQPTVAGVHQIYAWVNPTGTIAEAVNTNNKNFTSITVLPRPNLKVANIAYSVDYPWRGSLVTVSAEICNTGGIAVTKPFWTRFFDDGTVIATVKTTTSIPAGGSTILSCEFTAFPAGVHQITVVADYNNTIAESTENDNSLAAELLVIDEYDLIVNGTNRLEVSGRYLQRGFVIVKDNAILELNNVTFEINQLYANQFFMVVRDDANVLLRNAQFASNREFRIRVAGNPRIGIVESTVSANTKIIVAGNGYVTIDKSVVSGVVETTSTSNAVLTFTDSTFANALNIYGNAVCELTSTYAPAVHAYNNAVVRIYRWLFVDVVDGCNGRLQNAYAQVSYHFNGSLYTNGHTNATGKIKFKVLSDLITPDTYPSSHFVGNYKLNATYVYRSTRYNSALQTVTLQSYPQLGSAYNSATTSVISTVLPDINITAMLITGCADFNSTISINVSVKNTGITNAPAFDIKLYDSPLKTNLIKSFQIAGLSIAETVFVETTYRLVADIYTFYVIADSTNAVPESNEQNNQLTKLFSVNSKADLKITDIVFSPLQQTVGGSVLITATIYNEGGSNATDFVVQFFSEYDKKILIGESVVSVAPFSIGSVSCTWQPAKTGTYKIYAVADATDVVREEDETNNELVKNYLVLSRADFKVGTEDISVEPVPVVAGGSVQINVKIHNIGETAADAEIIVFDDLNANSQPEMNEIILNLTRRIDANSVLNLAFPWTATEPRGLHKLVVSVDTHNLTFENDETNNAAYKNVFVLKEPSDLVVGEAPNQNEVVRIGTQLTLNGWVVVENNGTLYISNVFEIFQSYPYQFGIIVRNNGTLIFENATLQTTAGLNINLVLQDCATLQAKNTRLKDSIHITCLGETSVLFSDTTIAATFNATNKFVELKNCVVTNDLYLNPNLLYANYTVFHRKLDDFAGSAIAYLTNVTILPEDTDNIKTSDSASVYIYRIVNIKTISASYDIISGAVVYAYTYTGEEVMSAIADKGRCSFRLLSDLIYYDNRHCYVGGGYTVVAKYRYKEMDYTTVAYSIRFEPYPSNANIIIRNIVFEKLIPDLEIRAADITINPSKVPKGTVTEFELTVKNVGSWRAKNITVRLSVDMSVFCDKTIPLIEDGASATLRWNWTAAKEGVHTLFVSINPAREIPEKTVANNIANVGFEVYLTPDLSITPDSIAFTEKSVVEDSLLGITVFVKNIGETDAYNFTLRFYIDMQTLINETVIEGPVRVGAEYPKFIWWRAERTSSNIIQNRTISIRIYDEDDVRLGNNFASKNITVLSKPDLIVGDMYFVDSNYKPVENLTAGKKVFLNATIINTGASSAEKVDVWFYASNSGGNITIGWETIELIDGLSWKSASISWLPTVAGAFNITAFVNRNCTVKELSTANNNLTVSVEIQKPLIFINWSLLKVSYPPGVSIFLFGEVRYGTPASPGEGVANAKVTIELIDAGGNILRTLTLVTAANGYFETSAERLLLPDKPGDYQIRVSTQYAIPLTATITIEKPFAVEIPILTIAAVIIVLIGVVGAVAVYFKKFRVERYVECGECGELLPEGLRKCPKCSTMFEIGTARCSNCQGWVPITAKECPECGVAFVAKALRKAIEDYELKLKASYQKFVTSQKAIARKKLGPKYSDKEFWNWWRKQPTYLAYEDWVAKEREKKKLVEIKCPACGTPHPPRTKTCSKCGAFMEVPPVAPPKAVPPPPPPEVKEEKEEVPIPKAEKPCIKCGEKIPVDTKFCSKCGAFQGIVPKRVVKKPVTAKVIYKKVVKVPKKEESTEKKEEG